MEGERLGEKYAYVFKDLANFARAENKIDETNIYQEANQKILPIVDKNARRKYASWFKNGRNGTC